MATEDILEVIATLIFLLVCIYIAFFLPSYLAGIYKNFNPSSVPQTALALDYEYSTIGNEAINVTVYYGPDPNTNFRIVEGYFTTNNFNYEVDFGTYYARNALEDAVTALIFSAISAFLPRVLSFLKFLPGISKVATTIVGIGSKLDSIGETLGALRYLYTGARIYAENFLFAESGYAIQDLDSAIISNDPAAFFQQVTSTSTTEQVAIQAAEATAISMISLALDSTGVGMIVSFALNFIFFMGADLYQSFINATQPYYNILTCNPGVGNIYIYQPLLFIYYSNNYHLNTEFESKYVTINNNNYYIAQSQENDEMYLLTGDCELNTTTGKVDIYPSKIQIEKEGNNVIITTYINKA